MIIDLLKYEECENKVFHIFNRNKISTQELVTCLNENGYDIHITDSNAFGKHIKDLLHDDRRELLAGLVNDLNKIMNSIKTISRYCFRCYRVLFEANWIFLAGN